LIFDTFYKKFSSIYIFAIPIFHTVEEDGVCAPVVVRQNVLSRQPPATEVGLGGELGHPAALEVGHHPALFGILC
jgi:hypothetical protein